MPSLPEIQQQSLFDDPESTDGDVVDTYTSIAEQISAQSLKHPWLPTLLDNYEIFDRSHGNRGRTPISPTTISLTKEVSEADEDDGSFRLDAHTREIGLAGIVAARQALKGEKNSLK